MAYYGVGTLGKWTIYIPKHEYVGMHACVALTALTCFCLSSSANWRFPKVSCVKQIVSFS